MSLRLHHLLASAGVAILVGASMPSAATAPPAVATTTPQVTVRKSRCRDPLNTSCANTDLAVAFCETDEVLIGGGCLVPGEDGVTTTPVNKKRQFPRPLTGLMQGPVNRAVASAFTFATPPHAGVTTDLFTADEGQGPMPLGAGWMCQISHRGAAGFYYPPSCVADAPTCFQGSWWFYTEAYAQCLRP